MPESSIMTRYAAPSAVPAAPRLARQMRSSSVLRMLALIALVASLSVVAVFTPWLIAQRQQAVEAAFDALVIHQVMDSAEFAVARLELDLEHGDAAAVRQQVAALAGLNIRHPVEARAEVAELQSLRRLIAEALPVLEALAPLDAPGASVSPHGSLHLLDRDIRNLALASKREIDRRFAAHQATDYTLPLVNLFIVCLILTTLLFVGALLYRDRALRLAHWELAAWGREMAALTSAMPGVLIRTRHHADGSWVRTFVANSVVALTGHSVEEALAPGWLRRNVEPPLAPLREAMDAALTGTERAVLVQFRRKDGRWIWLRVLMKAHQTRDGEDEVLCTFADVTREQDLARRAEHSARLAQLGELATSMAHELNQPLSGISLAAENAQRMVERLPAAAPRVVAKLELIVSQAMRASDIINSMRVFGRSAAGENETVWVERILDGALGLLHGRIEQSGVKIIRDLPPGLPRVLGKPVPLELALTNLVVNACDAYDAMLSPPPPGERWVQVAAGVETDRMRITVRDRAGGIAPSVMPKIFEPFFTTQPVGKASGLGLSISYGILTEMGGTLTAASIEGGTEFAITLPLAPLPKAAD